MLEYWNFVVQAKLTHHSIIPFFRCSKDDLVLAEPSVFDLVQGALTRISPRKLVFGNDRPLNYDYTPENIQKATIGIVVSLVFILPLVLVLMAWALSKFSASVKWRNVAWSGLIYCLTQDFIGLIAMFMFSLMMAGAIYQGVTAMVLPLVISIPPVLGVVFGYRVSSRYTPGLSKRRHALTALITVITLLFIQATLALIGIRFGNIL